MRPAQLLTPGFVCKADVAVHKHSIGATDVRSRGKGRPHLHQSAVGF
jgi:hypothetical protein